MASLAFGSQAQVIFTEDFTSPWSSSTQGWVITNNSVPVGPLSVFQGTSSYFPADNGNAGPNDYVAMNYQSIANNASGGISTWLITPTIGLSNPAILEFSTRRFNTVPDRLQVRLSPAGNAAAVPTGTTAVGTFTSLLLDINPLLSTSTISAVANNSVNGYPTAWTVYTVAIPAQTFGSWGRLAFRYFVDNGGQTGQNSYYIGIDRVRVYWPQIPCNSITNLSCGTASSFNLSAGLGSMNQQAGTEKIFAYTPVSTGQHTLTLSRSPTGNTSLYRAQSCNGATWAFVCTMSSNTITTVSLTSGVTEYFLIDQANTTASSGTIKIDCPPDPCLSISNLSCGSINSFTLPGTTGYLPLQPGREKIYSYLPSVSGQHTITLNHTTAGSLSLYSDQTCSTATWTSLGTVATNSGIPVGLTSGVMHYFLIDDGDINISQGNIKIDCPAPPVNPCLSITNLSCGGLNNFTLAATSGYLPLQPGREKIYSYTPTSTGNHTLTLNHASAGSISLYLAPTCNGGTAWSNVATITSNSIISLPLSSGATQYFLIDDNDILGSEFSITLECAAADPCLNITPILCESPISFSLAPGQGAWNITGPGNEKVYSFTPSLTGQYTLSLANTGQINLFSAAACSPSGWSTISSASSGNYTVQLISGVLVYILIDGTDGNAASGACTIKCPTQDACTLKSYGASKANSPDDEEIYNVSLGTLNNASSCSTVAPGPNSLLKQYSNFTGIVTAPVLVTGEQYPLSVLLGECGSNNCSNGGISVYIDYNADGSFEGVGEKVWSKSGCSATAAGKTYSTSITIPSSSPFGYKRMRVIFNCDGLTASTSTYNFGETEDYCVEISPPVGIGSEAARRLDVRVSPNPTSGQLNVQLEKNNNYTLHILNTLGQVILSQAADMQTTIDLKDINSGIYFLKVMDKNHTLYTTRIIKE